MTVPSSPVIYFFCGTDTEVGKTYCAAQWVKMRCQSGRRVGVYKPVASGCRLEANQMLADDAIRLWEAAGRPRSLAAVCSQMFLQPLAPPSAAKAEGRSVDESLLLEGARRWLHAKDTNHRRTENQNEQVAFSQQVNEPPIDELVVEGAGGLFSPLSDRWLNIDLLDQLRSWSLPVRTVLVAADRLGVQHQVIATCRAAASQQCPVDAIWLNRMPDPAFDPTLGESNRHWIGQHLSVPLVESAEELSAIW